MLITIVLPLFIGLCAVLFAILFLKLIWKLLSKDKEKAKRIIENLTIGVLSYKEIQDKIKCKNLEMKRTVEKIIEISEIVEPKQKLDIVKEDPDDNKIIECAIEGKSNCIITKDNHLLKIREYAGIRILTPSEFLKYE